MGATRKKVQKFLKRIDWFEKPITMSYKRKKQFETSAGGICTIIVFTILGWTAFWRLWDTYIGLNKYVLNAQTNIADTSE